MAVAAVALMATAGLGFSTATPAGASSSPYAVVTGQCGATYSSSGGHRYTSSVMVDVYNLPSSAQGGNAHSPRAYALIAPFGVNLNNGSQVDINVTGSSGTGSNNNGQLTRFSVGVFYRTPTNSVAELPTQTVDAPARSTCGKTGTSFIGSPPGSVSAPVVGMAVTPKDNGYWEVTADAHVYSFGAAAAIAAPGSHQFTLFPNHPIVGMAATADGRGYWLVASDGGVFTFGDAHFYGSTGAMHLNQPIVGMAATPDGGGYWLVASDGGVFTFGDAHFYGSMGGVRLNQPVVGMAADDATGGYWMVASDGGVFSFDAPFHGSTGNIRLNQPIVGMEAAANGSGYRFVASDGGVFCFNLPFSGSTGNIRLNRPVTAMAASGPGGYWLAAQDGGIFSFASPFYGSTG
jgi:hypothetical protein